MVTLVQAKKAQTLASDQDYRHPLPQYTPLEEDLRLCCAKKAHKLQSEVKGADLSLGTLLLAGLTMWEAVICKPLWAGEALRSGVPSTQFLLRHNLTALKHNHTHL